MMQTSKYHTYIPSDSDALQEKFINYLMLAGKKTIARKIFRDTLKELEKKGHKDPVKAFEKAIENVKPSVEVRPKRIGGAVYQIPMEVQPARRIMLAFRWIIEAARKGKGSPISNRLARELHDAVEETGTAIKKRDDTHKMAAANKAFAHYGRRY